MRKTVLTIRFSRPWAGFALSRMLLRTGIASAALLLTLMPLAQAADYQLGTMDKLRIKVVEWQTAAGAVRDWTGLGGDYLVGPAGTISLPFVGEVPAAGKTTSEVAAAIGEALQQTLGLPDKPSASVELAEFRPVFVAGDAATPGSYPFAPDLTVLKAVSLAGGLHRADSSQRVERDMINARGDETVLVASRNRLIVRRARLTAEAANADAEAFEAPAELKGVADFDSMLSDEQAIMATRTKRLRLQLESIEDLKRLLQSQIVALEKKVASQNRQIELTRQEQSNVGTLSDRGLVVNSRVMSVERTLAEMESKVLDYETALLQAKQDIVEASQRAIDLQNDREAEIAQQRQSAEADLKSVDLKIAMNRGLVAEALSRAPEAALNAPGGAVIRYAIVRESDGKTAELAAEENTKLLPGDVVKVTLVPAPATALN